jgi:hypothetical protein
MIKQWIDPKWAEYSTKSSFSSSSSSNSQLKIYYMLSSYHQFSQWKSFIYPVRETLRKQLISTSQWSSKNNRIISRNTLKYGPLKLLHVFQEQTLNLLLLMAIFILHLLDTFQWRIMPNKIYLKVNKQWSISVQQWKPNSTEVNLCKTLIFLAKECNLVQIYSVTQLLNQELFLTHLKRIYTVHQLLIMTKLMLRK